MAKPDESLDVTETGAPSGAAVSTFKAALKAVCPTCGQAKLYRGVLVLEDGCPICGQDFSKADPGDGPQVFVILILGFATAVMAAMVHAAWAPPAYIHMLIWPPMVVFLAIWLLRVIKAWLIGQQFRHDAHEARLIRDDDAAL